MVSHILQFSQQIWNLCLCIWKVPINLIINPAYFIHHVMEMKTLWFFLLTLFYSVPFGHIVTNTKHKRNFIPRDIFINIHCCINVWLQKPVALASGLHPYSLPMTERLTLLFHWKYFPGTGKSRKGEGLHKYWFTKWTYCV